MARLEGRLGAMGEQITKLQDETSEAEVSTAKRRCSDAAVHLKEWKLIEQASGRTGLPVLLIDAAGPAISSLTNDLLSASFGDQFQVELVTQVAKAGGAGVKETFDLRVYDAGSGGDRELTDLSGGEQVIVDESLKAALALYTNRLNQRIETCFRDETTGALDGENIDRYISMLRRLSQLGEFHHLLFVTHSEEAAERADVRVRVGGGKVEVA